MELLLKGSLCLILVEEGRRSCWSLSSRLQEFTHSTFFLLFSLKDHSTRSLCFTLWNTDSLSPSFLLSGVITLRETRKEGSIRSSGERIQNRSKRSKRKVLQLFQNEVLSLNSIFFSLHSSLLPLFETTVQRKKRVCFIYGTMIPSFSLNHLKECHQFNPSRACYIIIETSQIFALLASLFSMFLTHFIEQD